MQQPAQNTLWTLAAIGVFASALIAGCERQAAHRGRTLQSRGSTNEVYLRGVAATLNDLPHHVNLELLPAQPILTASNSTDGKEVRATCTTNPNTTDAEINYLRIYDGNANFLQLDVQPRDIVRYYVNVDEESAERGIEQRRSLELRVRRLDARDPANALIIEGSLDAPALMPQRIEIWRYSDKRMDAIRSAMNRYVVKRLPPAGWEPSPDLAALRQIVEHANLWLHNQPVDKEKWKPDPLLKTLPEEVRQAPGAAEQISPENLRDGVFADAEGRLLQQAVWARDIAQWARGNAVKDPDVAAALFDWTVRNIQLDRGDGAATIFHPWQALAYGHGSAAHRAWVFVELCRQQGIDAVLLQPTAKDGKPGPLLAAALVDDDMYLFDPELGLPLAAGKNGVATLAELIEQPELLRGLDVKDQFNYPLDAEAMKSVEALIVATPLQLARRSALVEAGLQGEDFVKLTVDTPKLAERLKKLPQVSKASLWAEPFKAIDNELTLKQTGKVPMRARAAAEFAPFADRPKLWNARVLHFQGNKEVRSEERNDPLAEPRRGHQEALGLYQNDSVRPSKDTLAALDPSKRKVYSTAKAEATYWLGLLSFDRGNYPVAAMWLDKQTLQADPQGPWTDGARYNLARTHEAMLEFGKAIALLESDPAEAPQRHGNLVRAARLRAAVEKMSEGKPKDGETAGEKSADETAE